ncbi:STAS domain-containing protein [Nakamurella flavida]|uniref:STAS domain-containing protein n=1 Tax=Nakamurella flavida TaxID=363630 RepID=A0A938YFE7_9ACTN|nr:STAS domain-containing protein [Nakamurella flavida]MBM9476675.1 STAS domain-containing protein [Nakamurella flavida]MDP9778887.1 anti-anti-sigma regulatory factor [Nakamurella flavida]
MVDVHGDRRPSDPVEPLPAVSSTDLQITGDLAVVGLRGPLADTELDRFNAVMREALTPPVRRIVVDARAVTAWADGGLELLAAASAQARLDGIDVVISGLGAAQRSTLRALGRRD